MERNMGQELEALKADYNALKAQMQQQEQLNERFFQAARRRPAQALSREIRNRLMLDVLTLPRHPLAAALRRAGIAVDDDRFRSHTLD